MYNRRADVSNFWGYLAESSVEFCEKAAREWVENFCRQLDKTGLISFVACTKQSVCIFLKSQEKSTTMPDF